VAGAYQLVLDAPEEEAPLIAAALESYAAPAPQSVSARRMGRAAPWRVEAIFDAAPDVRALEAFLASIGPGIAFGIAPLKDEDWVALSESQFPPIRTRCFYVRGPHVPPPEDLGARRLITIEAGLAFGTGHHSSTRGCLLMIEELMKRRFAPRRVLDLGAGTALLAIAVQKAWPAARVVASDNDPVAVRVSRENCALNAAPSIRHVLADGFKSAHIRAHARYDFVLANILAGPLRRLAPAVAGHTRAGGYVVLSGILDEQAPSVIAAYRAAQLRLVARRDLEGWATLLLRRAATSCGRRRD
jgi:ribosomal protein L11 methyltransferase